MKGNVSITFWKIKLILISTFNFTLASCDFIPKGHCEDFNVKRLPYNFDYYNRSLLYVSGEDSILYEVTDTYISKGYDLGGLATYCNPEMNINLRSSDRNMSYSFVYSLDEGDDPRTELFVHFHSSNIKLPVDSIFTACKRANGKTVELTKFTHSGYDKSEFIRRAKFKNMFFTEVEEYSGKVWKLVKIGDSIVR